ncbi:ribosome maturation factor RimM [Buchnera aphidicola (Taiwanaphis decaspermi)]|uniref:ribosome maturation factor RimM n=1 Tax=Buchnera aphidicola TaxID=9 RepID=UPI0031B855F6
MSSIYKSKKNIIIGKIGKPYGLLGNNKINSFMEKKSNIFKYIPWIIKKNIFQKLKIVFYKKTKMIAKIKGVNNRDQAQIYTGHNIYINNSKLPKLKYEEYYWKDIIKCLVYNMKINKLGMVTKLIETGSNDVLVVESSNKKLFIPFLMKKVIKKVNILNKIIIVDWDYNF